VSAEVLGEETAGMSEYAIYNPQQKAVDSLPVIYGFNNGGMPGLLSAVAIAEDGTCLGGHACSHEWFMEGDLGMLEGTRKDRHENSYQPHYPDGYRMEFVPSADIKKHLKLQAAFELNEKMEREATHAD
jgi:hypothetical protein